MLDNAQMRLQQANTALYMAQEALEAKLKDPAATTIDIDIATDKLIDAESAVRYARIMWLNRPRR